MPHPDAVPDTARHDLPLPPEGAVHMQNRFSRIVGKQGPDTGDLMDIVQDMLQRYNRFDTALFRAHDQGAALIGTTHGKQRRRTDVLGVGKFLNFFVENIPVFQREYKTAPLFCLGLFSLLRR